MSGFVDLIKKNVEDIDKGLNSEDELEDNISFLLNEKIKIDNEIVGKLAEIDDPLAKAFSSYLKWNCEPKKDFDDIIRFFSNLTDALKKYSSKDKLKSWIFEIFISRKIQFKLFDDLEKDIITYQCYLDKLPDKLFVVQKKILEAFSDAFIVLAKNDKLEKIRLIGAKIYTVCNAIEKRYIVEERYDLERYLINLKLGINKILEIEEEKALRVRLAVSHEDEGDSFEKKAAGYGLTSYAFAFMNYLDLNEKDRLEKVKSKLKASGNASRQSLKPIEVGRFRVSFKDWFQSLISLVKYYDILESLTNLSVIYPTLKTLNEKEIGISIQIAPYIIIDDDSNVSAILQWSREQEECRKYKAFQMLRFYETEYSAVRCHFFKFLTDTQLLVEDDLKQVIYSAPIDEKLKNKLILGVNKHFLRDFISSSYILTLQLEPLLITLAKLKANTIAITRKPKRQGATQETTLGKLLENPKVSELFDRDFYNLFQSYFTYDLGLNLRNKIAHGLVNHEELTEEYSCTVLFFVFRMLFMFRVPRHTGFVSPNFGLLWNGENETTFNKDYGASFLLSNHKTRFPQSFSAFMIRE